VSAQNGLVQRLWSYCNILRDDGLSYGDYLEQLTYLLFLKMAHERATRMLRLGRLSRRSARRTSGSMRPAQQQSPTLLLVSSLLCVELRV